jgi:hypothetical protein
MTMRARSETETVEGGKLKEAPKLARWRACTLWKGAEIDGSPLSENLNC